MYALLLKIFKKIIGGLFGSSRRRQTASRHTTVKNPRRKGSAAQRCFDGNRAWLYERWALASAHERGQGSVKFPSWYFDDSTTHQHKKLAELGIDLPSSASKGQFSDVIGLFSDPDSEDLERLKFFGIKLSGSAVSETRVRHELSVLDARPDTAALWAGRPPTKIQKEFFRFIGSKLPTDITASQATAHIQQALGQLSSHQKASWENFVDIVQEFADPDFCESEDIRKPTLTDIRTAFDALSSAPRTGSIDASEVAEYLLTSKPSLARR